MPRPVVISGAILKCIAGSAPSRLATTTAPFTRVGGVPVATVADHLPIVHVKPLRCLRDYGSALPPPDPDPLANRGIERPRAFRVPDPFHGVSAPLPRGR